MRKLTASRPADLKQENRTAILQYIYYKEVFTKPDIYNYLKISKPTVSLLIDELVGEGVLTIVGRGNSTTQGGKRPLLYSFNARNGLVIAVHISVDKLSVALTDLKLAIEFQTEQRLPHGLVQHAMEQLVSMISQLHQHARSLGISVWGIGISAPGVVESQQGILLNAINLEGWTGVPLVSELKSRFNLPVWVDNESRNVAMAEKWFGNAKELNTFITVLTRDGIGTGIVHNGVAYCGLDYSAGEFGHTTIDMNGPACRCGNHGCWELYGSEHAFLNSIHTAIDMDSSSSFSECKDKTDEIILSIVGDLFQKGDVQTVKYVSRYASHLAIGLVNLVNTFNPEAIILHGGLMVFGQPFLDQLITIVHRSALHPASRRVNILYTKFLDDAPIIGGASLVIKEIIEGRLRGTRS